MYNKPSNLAFIVAINSLAYVDQKTRHTGKQDGSIDKKNTILLLEITRKIGWPTISKVGRNSSYNSWLIAQHAELLLMEYFYSKMIENYLDIDPENILFLEDRILAFKYDVQIH